ncbi:MAG: AAA family ATPase [Bacteroidaceae bacterium]|nr:AAA family ATPase [Bacteroidaceae bacterium]
MKFLKLEILNLASLDRQGGETIDFEEGALGDSTIFSIVGPTGSGKSTILDAICLALYNRAPRYPRKKGERNQYIEIFGDLEEGEKNRLAPTDSRNILTRGRKEGYSKLTFQANNGIVYRAEWSARKMVKNYGEPITSLYKLTKKDGLPAEEMVEWKDLPQIIGLDYEQFLRTVLIAQGSFANFLKAKEDERYELLEKLVGCKDLYNTIAEKIRVKRDEAVDRCKNINADYAAFNNSIIPQEELELLTERISQLEAEEKKVKDEMQKVRDAIAWYVANEKRLGDIAEYTEAVKRAEAALDEAKDIKAKLKLHDSTLPAVDLYKDMAASEKDAEEQQLKLKSIAEGINNATGEIDREEKVLAALKQKEKEAKECFEQQKPHINKARAIKVELVAIDTDVKEKESALDVCKKSKNSADKDVADNAESIKKDKAAYEKACNALAELQTSINKQKEEYAAKVAECTESYNAEYSKMSSLDAAKLQDAKSVAEGKLHDLNEAIRIAGGISELRKKIDENKGKIQALQKRNSDIATELKGIDIEALAREVNTIRNAHTLMTSENWAQHRKDLADGEPCPLCGSTSHPFRNQEVLVPVISDLTQLLDDKEKLLREKTVAHTSLTSEQAANEATVKTLNSANDDNAKENERLSKAWDVVHAKHPEWGEDKDALEALLPATKKEVADSARALADYNTLSETVDKMRKAKEKAEKSLLDYDKSAEAKLRKAEQDKTNADTALKTETGKTDNLIKQQKEKNLAFVNAQDALSAAKKEQEKKTAELQAELDGKDPDRYEAELSKAKDDSDKAVEIKVDDIHKKREELTRLTGQKKVTEDNINKEKKIYAESKDALDVWIVGYNAENEVSITIDTIASLCSATENWENVRQQMKDLDDALTKAQTTLKNEQKEYDEHLAKKPEAMHEDLIVREAELNQWSAHELTNLKAKLQNHEEAKKKMGAMFDEKQAAELLKNEWVEITDAIGGEGRTLRKIAQCYTLRFLVEHANVELLKFNNRYELQHVKNSLGIRIIDHDRADDIRDTTSLSGGETFIVSLALALGLSSLSSRNISFGNLFIDEGFGTLDPDTLALVIDSLAMLQSSQGKKVGVISHTDTMSERISTQIRVIKNGNSGSSHIEIYPS